MSEVVFTQWKVVGPSEFGIRKKSYDNMKMAKVEFGKACKNVEKEGSLKVSWSVGNGHIWPVLLFNFSRLNLISKIKL